MVDLVQGAIDLAVAHGRIDAKLLLPHPTTVARNVSARAEGRLELKPEIELVISQRRCGATVDQWTENSHSLTYVS